MFHCKYCNSPLIQKSSTILECPKCHVRVDMVRTEAIPMAESPDYIKDSYAILLRAATYQDDLFVFGKKQLFDEEFRTKDCIVSDAASVSKDMPEELLVYQGIDAGTFKKLLLQFHKDGVDIPNSIKSMSAGRRFFVEYMLPVEQDCMSYQQFKTLSALVTMTWADCYEVYRNNIPFNIYDMPKSSVLYSLVACNKSGVIQNMRFERVSDALVDFMYNQSKFIHNQNPQIGTTTIKNETAEVILASCPELWSANTHSYDEDFVLWLFATNAPYRDLKERTSLATAKGLEVMWFRYGAPYSVAQDMYMNLYEGSNTEAYIKYWTAAREKLRR